MSIPITKSCATRTGRNLNLFLELTRAVYGPENHRPETTGSTSENSCCIRGLLDRSNNNQLSIKINPQGKRLALRLNAGSKFLSQENNLGDFVYSKRIDGKRPQEIVITRRDFEHQEGKTLEWAKIATFEVTLIDRETNQKVILTSKPGQEFIESINLTKTEPN